MRCDGKTKLAIESLEDRRLLTLNAPVPILPDYAFSTGFSKPDWIASSDTEHYWRDKAQDQIWKTDGTAVGTKAISLDGLYPSSHVVLKDDSIIVAATASSYNAYPNSSSIGSYGEFSSSDFVTVYGSDPVAPTLPPDQWELLSIDANGVVEELARIQHEPKVANGHFFYVETVIRNDSESQDLWMYDTDSRTERVVAEHVDDGGLKVAINDNYFYSRGNRTYGTDLQVFWQADYISQVRQNPTTQTGAYYLNATAGPGLYYSDGSQSGQVRVVELDHLDDQFTRYQHANSNAVLTLYSSDANGDVNRIWLSNGTAEDTRRLQIDSPSPRVRQYKSDVYVYGGESLLHVDLATLHVTEVSGFNAADYQVIDVEFGRLLAVKFFTSIDGTERAKRDLFDSNGKISSLIVPMDQYRVPNLATVPHVPYQYAVTEDGILFFANDAVSGFELWTSAESPESAQIVVDLHPNPNTNAVWEVADETLFVTYGENWQEHKKVEVRGESVVEYSDDIRINLAGKIVSIADETVVDAHGQRLIDDQLTLISHQRVNERLLMVVAWPNNRRELWSTDGTSSGTFQVLNYVHRFVTSIGDIRAFYQVSTSRFISTDGTLDGTRETGTKQPWKLSSDQASAVIADGTAHFLSDQGYREFDVPRVNRMMGDKLWVSDELGDRLTDGLGTIQLPMIPQRQQSTDGRYYYDVHDKTIFATDEQIWQSDGTADGTFPFWSGTERFSGAIPIPDSETILFSVYEGDGVYANYAYDGKESHFVSRELPGFEVEWRTTGEFALLDDGRGIWATDGTVANSFNLFEENADFIDAMNTDAFGEFVFFTEFSLSRKKDRRIWVTDGTRSGTRDLGSFGNSSIIYGEDLYTAGEDGLVRRPLSRWHNYSSPYDTTADRQLTPRDALVVINELINREHSDPVSSEIKSPNTAFFYDVSQDRLLTPIDALRVINELIRNNRVPMAAAVLRSSGVARTSHSVAGAFVDAPTERKETTVAATDDFFHQVERRKAAELVSPIPPTAQLFSIDFASSRVCDQEVECSESENADASQ